MCGYGWKDVNSALDTPRMMMDTGWLKYGAAFGWHDGVASCGGKIFNLNLTYIYVDSQPDDRKDVHHWFIGAKTFKNINYDLRFLITDG